MANGALVSTHLGPIVLDGGAGGGAMNGAVEHRGRSIPVRLEIDFPSRLDEDVVNKVDRVFDNIDYLQEIAVPVLEQDMRRSGSTVAALAEAWCSLHPERELAEFPSQLRVRWIMIQPDGESSNVERIRISFSIPNEPLIAPLQVRYMEGIGPELATMSRPDWF